MIEFVKRDNAYLAMDGFFCYGSVVIKVSGIFFIPSAITIHANIMEEIVIFMKSLKEI